MSNIFDFGPIADVAEKLAKNAVNNVVGTDDNKPSLNIQLPDKVVESVRNTWNNLTNANQAQPQVARQSRQVLSNPKNSGSYFSDQQKAIRPTFNSQTDVPLLQVPSNLSAEYDTMSAFQPDNAVIAGVPILSPIEQLMQNAQADQTADRSLSPSIDRQDEQDGSYKGSARQLQDLQRDFQEEQQRKLDQAKSAIENQLYGQYAQYGLSQNPYDDPTFQQNLESIRNMDEVPYLQSEIARRFTDGNGNFETNPLNWNLLGFTSQNQTPDAARALYDFHFDKEDRDLREGDPLARVAAARKRRDAIDRGEGTPGLFGVKWDEKILDPYAIDNGIDSRSRESLFMTGEQYIKYRDEFGLPGRDVKDINPDEIYSKQDEQDRYGFIPYITSEESLQRFHDAAAPQAVSNVFNRVANARRENTDFDVNYDGKKISGHDLIRQGNLWWKRNSGKVNDAEVITDPSKATEDSVPYTYVLTDSSGNQIVAKSALVNSYIDEQNHPVMQFEDGDVWTFDDMDDYQRSLGEQIAADGEHVSYWKNIEPLVLDDGTKLRADKAEQLLSDSNYQNFADYGDFNWNMPYIEDPFVDRQGNFNLNPAENSFLPWITDTALGSVPYFFKPTAAAQGVGNAAASATGLQPGYQDFLNGTYSLLSNDPTREQQVSATVGSLALPITEHLWGNIGGNLIGKPFMKAIGKNEKDIAPLLRYGMGTVGEGLEEIPGNAVEQFQGGSGLSGWYADDMYRDENGNLTTQDTGIRAYDDQGNVIKNTNTDFVGRMHNFVNDIPLAFIGGMTMGGTLGAPAIRSYYNEYTPRKREREEFGNNLERPDFDSNLVVDLTDEERDYYNR